jgi:hypothetical protein
MEENPPLSVVQRFVHLLDARDVDYSEEIGIYYNKIIFIIFFLAHLAVGHVSFCHG